MLSGPLDDARRVQIEAVTIQRQSLLDANLREQILQAMNSIDVDAAFDRLREKHPGWLQRSTEDWLRRFRTRHQVTRCQAMRKWWVKERAKGHIPDDIRNRRIAEQRDRFRVLA